MTARSVSTPALLPLLPSPAWLVVAAVLVALAATGVIAWRRRRRARPESRRLPADSTRPPPLLLFPEARDDRSRWTPRALFAGPPAGPRRLHSLLLLLAVVVGGAAAVAAAPTITRLLRPAPRAWIGGSQDTPRSASGREELDTVAGAAPAAELLGDRPGVAVALGPADAGAPSAREPAAMAVDPETGERLVLWSGDGQEGAPGAFLPAALSVILRDSTDRPVSGREVRFVVAGGGGRVEPEAARTSASGLALTRWWPGLEPDSLRVAAVVADRPALSLRFRARLSPGSRAAALAAERTGSGAPGADSVAGAAEAPSDDTAVAPPAPVARRMASALAAGGVHTCRIGEDGVVDCWGGTATVFAPARLGGQDAGEAVRSLRAGVLEVCGVVGSDRVLCWPMRPDGAAPAGAAEVRIPGGGPIVDLGSGTEHACALDSGGVVYCWGSNPRGQLGNGTTSDAASPVAVSNLPASAALAVGWLHGCALTPAGAAFCWGANGAGQLGDGSATDRPTPVAVAQPAPFAVLAAGSSHTCGLTASGAAWCWGDNAHGQLGRAGGARAARPTRVDTEVAFVALVAGGVHTCALTAGGRAWCWGRNTFGQLGDGTLRDSPLPTPVAGDLRFTTLAAGGAHTCGQAAGGGAYCWGSNIQGQLGDGTRQDRPTPTRVSR